MIVLTIKLLNSFSHYHVRKKNLHSPLFFSILILSHSRPLPPSFSAGARCRPGTRRGRRGDVAAWVRVVAVAAGQSRPTGMT